MAQAKHQDEAVLGTLSLPKRRRNCFSVLNNYIVRRLRFFAWAALLAVIVGQLPFWLAELFSHFLPYYAAIWLFAALCDKTTWRYLWAALAVLSLVWLLQGKPLARIDQGQGALMWYNVHLHNSQTEQEVERILTLSPALIALAENVPHDKAWQALRRQYRYGCAFAEDSPFALALWSKMPLEDCVVRQATDFPYLYANYQGMAIFVLHPPPPITMELAAARRAYLQAVAEEMRHDEQVLAVGDLNSSPFSPLFRRLLKEAAVEPQTPYYLATWQPFFLNIDHVLARNVALEVMPLDWLGSDHRPLLLKW